MVKRLIGLILALLGVCFVIFVLARRGGADSTGLWLWVGFYREGLRTPLFTGCLTMGTFLLTLQATILMRIKEIYDTDDYKAQWEVYQDQRRQKKLAATGYYDPLRNLGLALLANVLLALVTAILQVTLGFVNAPWAVAVCLGFAATTLGLLLLLWWQIAANLIRWFSEIEKSRKAAP